MRPQISQAIGATAMPTAIAVAVRVTSGVNSQ
jgi:hypothetical protein